MEPLVKVAPKELQLVLNPDQKAKCDILVESFSNETVIYKMRVNDRSRYSVNPPAGVLGPQQSVTITITMAAYSQVPPDVYSCKDMFLLQTAVKPDTKLVDISEIWQTVSKKSIAEERIRVKLSIGSGNRWKEVKQRNVDEADRKKNTATTSLSQGVPKDPNYGKKQSLNTILKAQELGDILEKRTRECEELRAKVLACRGELDSAVKANKTSAERFFGVPLLHIVLMITISILSIRLLV
eukprot:Plantae.Rhodophyta-Purpureofilum_apyrenoidigerum.ctg1035.p1 GENE.Plantae.Rhodophyta-Purpureofilum_apyrenoidigerum.ctg1035~~Plantae.Rhodophyta-Purpureofilum_apyrenoidigerum.ctg1035.p1  ORF type:complete len:240 (-),score=43.67 Plantae.Rhodophyta-Purpureofilum_apyrenoidigerum.ctg1035:925-1644(-)